MPVAQTPTIAYIDGYNFYFGLRKTPAWREFYWINIVQLMETFIRPEQELVAVKYFTARPLDQEKALRQDLWFQANSDDSRFQLHLGHYLRKEFECYGCGRIIKTYEEKESDVRLATEIVADAYSGAVHTAIVVSADSDMIPAVEHALRAGANVHIYFPPNQHSSALSRYGMPTLLSHYKSRFRQSLLPDVVHLPNTDIVIPPQWKAYQR